LYLQRRVGWIGKAHPAIFVGNPRCLSSRAQSLGPSRYCARQARGNPMLVSTLQSGSQRLFNAGVTAMKQVFDQLLKFLHEGISAIFRFVELIWTWSVDQISKLMAVPWQEWPLWKQVLLVLVLAAVIWALYRAGRELLEAGAAILAAFAGLLGVLVQTLPHVFLAGVIALGGVWLINHLDNSALRIPGWMQASQQNNSPQNHQGGTAQDQ
jgi:hypothetical protein